MAEAAIATTGEGLSEYTAQLESIPDTTSSISVPIHPTSCNLDKYLPMYPAGVVSRIKLTNT